MSALAWRSLWVAAGVAAAAVLGSGNARGEETPPAKAEPKDSIAFDLVREALHAEIDGRSRDRAALLREAQRQSPDLPAVRWQTGSVRSESGWRPIDQAALALEDDSRRVAYYDLREKSADTLPSHLRLADFCERKGLKDEGLAHWSRVIDFSPDHLEARHKLGHRRIGGRWLTAEEAGREIRRSEALAAGLKAWRGKIESIAKGWNAADEHRRRAARDQLAAIKDPSVVPALEHVLSNLSAEAALASVEKIASFDDPEASQSLARHAVLLPWPEVREKAARKLKGRSEDDYVPLLLSAMSHPIDSRTSVAEVGGRLLHRHEFLREGQDAKQVLVFDTAYRRVEVSGGDLEDTLTRALVGMTGAALEREHRRLAENELIAQLNERIASVLTTAAGKKLSARPEECWQWWNDRNEQFVVGGKTMRTSYRMSEIEVYDRLPQPVPEFEAGPQQETSPRGSYTPKLDALPHPYPVPPTPQVGHTAEFVILAIQSGGSCCCLVAGTVVQTSSGPKPIEKIRVGDLVLAQHPRTGEIAFKPVLRTTSRPPEATVRIVTAADTIQCTGAHPFWVAGAGWVKARALKSGSELHTVAGPMRVSEVRVDEFAPTYNLIVADFHTYFVGPEKVLSHDNTIRLPTVTVVPGLIEK